jgi:glycine amidinotransferase/scyllo-inosamine-4-phosphate amidinotransferase 1
MNRVNSNTEWGEIKEIILGRVDNASIPCIKNKDIHSVDYANYSAIDQWPAGYYPERVIEETAEDLNLFQQQLESIGITVLRPDVVDFAKIHATNEWQSDGYYNYCPRDSALIIGDTIIETPMPLRSRYFENFSYRNIFKNYFNNGSRWISAPKGQLLDELYDRTDLSRPTLTEFEPAFDAANVIKCGKDIFFLISNSGNRSGARWLQSTLGEKYTVHILDNIYAYVHLDTTILPLSQGTVLLNPARVNESNLPSYFKNWKKIWSVEPIATSFYEHWAPASPWLGMNVLSLNNQTVAVEKTQTGLIKQLQTQGFDVLEVQLRHCRTLSGGPHCVTLDTVRDDAYGDYSC